MYSVKDLSDKELRESIKAWQEEIDNVKYGESINYAEGEIHIQKRELERRKKIRDSKIER